MLPSSCLLLCPQHDRRGLNPPPLAAFITNTHFCAPSLSSVPAARTAGRTGPSRGRHVLRGRSLVVGGQRPLVRPRGNCLPGDRRGLRARARRRRSRFGPALGTDAARSTVHGGNPCSPVVGHAGANDQSEGWPTPQPRESGAGCAPFPVWSVADSAGRWPSGVPQRTPRGPQSLEESALTENREGLTPP